ncbi:MAG: hypothetical protein C4B56_03115 [Candidatus Methanophagaceae archaeon]|nr:MAG: hypothetical protein C4B56_03115 [Methanophagales archaeon]
MVAVNNNYGDIEEKWQRRWHEARIFDAEPGVGGGRGGDRGKKFFITVPYPYTSGPLHIGHGRTYTIGDIIARFKRLEGYNVLFPMAFHVTGTPILAIADSIARGDAEVVARYRDYVSIYEREERVDEIVNSFSDAEAVAKFFTGRIAEDFKRMGYSIDWRRKFNTTEPILILNAYLVPKWEISLRKEALIRATHASTAIEGNPLSLEEVSKLAQGRKVTATRRAKQEVLNYLNVLENIEKYQEAGKIKETHILNLHRDITKETLDNPEWEGKYRDIQVYVGNKITGEIIFTHWGDNIYTTAFKGGPNFNRRIFDVV